MHYFLTGTDTDVGKTIVSAWAMLHMEASYWKPIQSGFEDGTDSQTVQTLTECTPSKILPSAYVLKEPLSPHEAAKRENVRIEMNRLSLPPVDGPLIVEGAGGLMVPINDEQYIIDLIADLALPTILVTRSTLGTINHTLLSLQALRDRNITVTGVVMNGPKTPHNREAIETYGKVRVIAEIPELNPLDARALLSIKPEINLTENKND